MRSSLRAAGSFRITSGGFLRRCGIALREVPLKTGPCDYLLLVDRKALGVIEAKKEGATLSTVADQSGRYADSLPDFLAAGLTGTLPFPLRIHRRGNLLPRRARS